MGVVSGAGGDSLGEKNGGELLRTGSRGCFWATSGLLGELLRTSGGDPLASGTISGTGGDSFGDRNGGELL